MLQRGQPSHDTAEPEPLVWRYALGQREIDSKAFEPSPTLIGCLFRLYPQRYATGPEWLAPQNPVDRHCSDIIAYLDHRYPAKCVYPDGPAARVHARAWERVADTFVDPILVDISYWKWAERSDAMPEGLLEAAPADLRLV
jgi:hypothetical protein